MSRYDERDRRLFRKMKRFLEIVGLGLILVFAATGLMNPELTRTQHFIEFWDWWFGSAVLFTGAAFMHLLFPGVRYE